MEIEEYINLYGGKFVYRNEGIEYISTLAPGYIINKEGFFIPVKDYDDHASIFSEYLSYYLNKQISLNTIEAIILLVNLGHIVYMGIKLNDIKAASQNSNNQGYGILILPENIDCLTGYQKKSIIELVNRNKSIFSNNEKVHMEYHLMSNKNSREITRCELKEIVCKKRVK